jgi:1,4-alpha-glucan branching enzyme
MVFKRKGIKPEDELLVILNMTPVVRNNWEIYSNGKAYTKELFNSDSKNYWGTGDTFNPEIRCELINKEDNLYKIIINLPPLAGIVLK